MLNLLLSREIADYATARELAPTEGSISGQQAYQVYMSKMNDLFHKMGCTIQFSGKAEAFLIGPSSETWDAVLLVKYPNKATFLGFANHKIYLKNVGHRTAALADSRLLPILPGSIF